MNGVDVGECLLALLVAQRPGVGERGVEALAGLGQRGLVLGVRLSLLAPGLSYRGGVVLGQPLLAKVVDQVDDSSL